MNVTENRETNSANSRKTKARFKQPKEEKRRGVGSEDFGRLKEHCGQVCRWRSKGKVRRVRDDLSDDLSIPKTPFSI